MFMYSRHQESTRSIRQHVKSFVGSSARTTVVKRHIPRSGKALLGLLAARETKQELEKRFDAADIAPLLLSTGILLDNGIDGDNFIEHLDHLIRSIMTHYTTHMEVG